MGQGRRPNIPKQNKEELKKIFEEKSDWNFIDQVLNQTKKFNNTKQTLELLSEIASLDSIKDLSFEGLENIDFSEDAKNLVENLPGRGGCIAGYEDPDQYSLKLYMFFGKFLLQKKVLLHYKIIFDGNAFALECEYGKNNEKVILGTDGISIKTIKKYHYNQNCYKQLGGFLIWPRHREMTINQRRGISSIDDKWDATMRDIEKFYNKEVSELVKSPIDKGWMEYLGQKGAKCSEYENFKFLFELDEVEYDSNGIITEKSLVKRNEKMWMVVKN